MVQLWQMADMVQLWQTDMVQLWQMADMAGIIF
jgi:hypothetical protein